MILVTGATGPFGQATIEALLKKGIPPTQIAALVRDPEKAADTKSKGIALRVGNYDHPDTLLKAFTGVEKLLFVSGNDISTRLTQHQNVVNAAQAAGIQQVVYTSFLGKNETATSPLWMVAESHLQTEAWLKESGLPHTILKNTLYMDFVPAFLGEKVLETGVIYLPAGTGKVGAVLRTEMAEAAAQVLTSHNHEGKTYHLTNEEAFSYPEVAELLSAIAQKPIQYHSPTPEEYAQTLGQLGVPADFIGLFSAFAVAQAQGELESVGTDLEQLLARKPTSIRTFLHQVYSGANA